MVWKRLANSEVNFKEFKLDEYTPTIYLVTFEDPIGYVVVASEQVKPYKGEEKYKNVLNNQTVKLHDDASKLADEAGYILVNSRRIYQDDFSYVFGVVPKGKTTASRTNKNYRQLISSSSRITRGFKIC
eukprot:GHVT01042929.1.p1 GENE.GHVT01042929.1~~GHVT01042929.1.p1  ORF type:complete len:129 (-),score=2.88 GHVT01042929.1:197-583(-)